MTRRVTYQKLLLDKDLEITELKKQIARLERRIAKLKKEEMKFEFSQVGPGWVEAGRQSGWTDEQITLIEGYFALRLQSDLRKEGWRFEAQRWEKDGDVVLRRGTDGSELRVYRIDGDIEATLTFPDGLTKTYA